MIHSSSTPSPTTSPTPSSLSSPGPSRNFIKLDDLLTFDSVNHPFHPDLNHHPITSLQQVLQRLACPTIQSNSNLNIPQTLQPPSPLIINCSRKRSTSPSSSPTSPPCKKHKHCGSPSTHSPLSTQLPLSPISSGPPHTHHQPDPPSQLLCPPDPETPLPLLLEPHSTNFPPPLRTPIQTCLHASQCSTSPLPSLATILTPRASDTSTPSQPRELSLHTQLSVSHSAPLVNLLAQDSCDPALDLSSSLTAAHPPAPQTGPLLHHVIMDLTPTPRSSTDTPQPPSRMSSLELLESAPPCLPTSPRLLQLAGHQGSLQDDPPALPISSQESTAGPQVGVLASPSDGIQSAISPSPCGLPTPYSPRSTSSDLHPSPLSTLPGLSTPPTTPAQLFPTARTTPQPDPKTCDQEATEGCLSSLTPSASSSHALLTPSIPAQCTGTPSATSYTPTTSPARPLSIQPRARYIRQGLSSNLENVVPDDCTPFVTEVHMGSQKQLTRETNSIFKLRPTESEDPLPSKPTLSTPCLSLGPPVRMSPLRLTSPCKPSAPRQSQPSITHDAVLSLPLLASAVNPSPFKLPSAPNGLPCEADHATVLTALVTSPPLSKIGQRRLALAKKAEAMQQEPLRPGRARRAKGSTHVPLPSALFRSDPAAKLLGLTKRHTALNGTRVCVVKVEDCKMGRPRPPSPDASFRKHSSRGFRVERVDDDEFEPQAAMRRVKWQDPIAVDLEEVEGEPKPPNPSKSILVTKRMTKLDEDGNVVGEDQVEKILPEFVVVFKKVWSKG